MAPVVTTLPLNPLENLIVTLRESERLTNKTANGHLMTYFRLQHATTIHQYTFTFSLHITNILAPVITILRLNTLENAMARG